MSTTALGSPGLRLDALRQVRALREDIATRISWAKFGVDADSDLAEAIEGLSEWLDEGKARMDEALRQADCAARDADEEYAESIVLAAE